MSAAAPPAAPKPVPPLSKNAAEHFARHIAHTHFGHRPKHLQRLAGGLTNAVFSFRVEQRRIVLRMNADASKIQDYQKEGWAMERAREQGVPTPEVLEVANQAGGPAYMIEEAVTGVPGHEHPDRLRITEQLGAAARLVHAIPTAGNGSVFDWSKNRLSRHETWAQFLDQGLRVAERIDFLARQKLIDAARVADAHACLEEMRRWRRPAALQHGDLRLKNTIVDVQSGAIRALIDWEHCLSGPPPFWDLSIALHDLGIDAKEAFLRGYGLTPRRYAASAPFVNVLNLVNYAGPVRAVLAAGDRERLAWLRARLNGLLDLHVPSRA